MPFICMRTMDNLAYFSMAVLLFSVLSFAFITYLSADIVNLSVDEANSKYGLHLKDSDRDFKYWDWLMFPIFIANFMNVFEGS